MSCLRVRVCQRQAETRVGQREESVRWRENDEEEGGMEGSMKSWRKALCQAIVVLFLRGWVDVNQSTNFHFTSTYF